MRIMPHMASGFEGLSGGGGDRNAWAFGCRGLSSQTAVELWLRALGFRVL